MVKILVISDSHGLKNKVDEIIQKHSDATYKVHLGDSQMSVEWLKKRFDFFVGGNCDSFSWTRNDLREQIFEVNGVKIFICHGHEHIGNFRLESISPGESICSVAQQRGCQLAMYGHMHTLVWKKINDIFILNPGSIQHSRDDNRESYAILKIDSKSSITCMPFFL